MAAQLPDRILYNQEYYNLFTNPLEMYWKHKKRPRFCPRDDCRRGYIATWEIRDNQLLLREIDGLVRRAFPLWGKNVVRYNMGKLFGRRQTVVKASWFSGKLRIPIGKMIMFADNGYDSRFASEIIVSITEGKIDRIVTLDTTNQKLIINEEAANRAS